MVLCKEGLGVQPQEIFEIYDLWNFLAASKTTYNVV